LIALNAAMKVVAPKHRFRLLGGCRRPNFPSYPRPCGESYSRGLSRARGRFRYTPHRLGLLG